MKYISIIAAILLLPAITFAALPVAWNATSTSATSISPNKINGVLQTVRANNFVATSTTARSQTLAFPQYVHSIPTNGDNQDVVSMGTDAALVTAQVVEHAFIVLAIELVALSQAADCTPATASKLSTVSKASYKQTRQYIATTRQDISMTKELASLLASLR